MTDLELQIQVQNALAWDPSIDAGDIGVSVESGVVTLRGDVRCFSDKESAARVALAVYGVKAVANDVKVCLDTGHLRSDTEIAQAVVSALRWNTSVPDDKVTAAVDNAWVTLRGHVNWDYQREAAFTTVRSLTGVRGVTNSITLEPHVSAVDVKAKIEEALKRSVEVDARRINVAVTGGKVTLSGNVHSWSEREEARHAAWAAPGVKEVDDLMAIVP